MTTMVFRKSFSSHPLSYVKVGVTANIILGSPKKNCDGIGICRIERAIPGVSLLKSEKDCCQAQALLTDDGERLIFYFVRATLQACVLRKQFIKGVFKMSDVASIPNDISVELGFPPNSYIKTGKYRVVDLGLHLCIAVKVGTQQQVLTVAGH